MNVHEAGHYVDGVVWTSGEARRPVYLHEIRSLADAMAVRRIRNGVREFMTGDTSEIGRFRQARWWWRVYRPGRMAGTMVAFLVRPAAGGSPIGYGFLREEWGRWWVTGAIVEGARGYGYGRALFATLTAVAVARGGAAFLEVRRDNVRAVRLYERLGYVLRGEGGLPGETAVMAYLPPRGAR